jgi:CrcB protein
MDRLWWIGLGGAVGTLARYGVAIWCQQRFGASFPWGTLVVNVIGSFLLAVVMQVAISTTLLSETSRLALSTGVMGGFTTYSSFNYETTKLFEQGAWKTACVYVAVTVLACLMAGLLGAALAKRLVGG